MNSSSPNATSTGLMSLPTELHLLILAVIKPIDQWCLRLTNHHFHGLIEPPSRQDLRDLAASLNRGRRRHKQFFICTRCNLLRPAKAAQSYDERMRGVYLGENTWRGAVCEDYYCRRRTYYEFKLSVEEAARYVSATTTQPMITTTQPMIATTQPTIATTQPTIATTQPTIATTQSMVAMAQASGSEPPRQEKEKKGMKKRARTWWTGVKGKASGMKGRAGKVAIEVAAVGITIAANM